MFDFGTADVGRREVDAGKRHEFKDLNQRETGNRIIGWGAYLGENKGQRPRNSSVRLLFIGPKRGAIP